MIQRFRPITVQGPLDYFRNDLGIIPNLTRFFRRVIMKSRRALTQLWMVLGVLSVAAAGLWDAQQQAEFALRQLVREHHLLAVALAKRLTLPAIQEPGMLAPSSRTSEILAAARLLEEEGNVVVLVHAPGQEGFSLSDGRVFANRDLDRALAENQTGMTLTRDVAADLGLPPRAAVAGLANLASTAHEQFGVAVVGSAGQERDRTRHDDWRTVLTVLFASGLILAFGIVELRRQREEMERVRLAEVHSTERERDVELARADRMAAIAALSSGIAHEISSPLGIISGRIEQLQSQSNTATQEKLFKSIATQVAYINKVIRGFLAFARGDAPALVHVAALKVAEEAVGLVKHRFGTVGVELRLSVEKAGAIRVNCEPALFEQALANVLVNALEASEAGQTVELQIKPQGDRVQFVVIDDGSGIPPAAIAHVTDPFFTTKARKGGSGLGLAIAKEIIAHHRGSLALEHRAQSGGAATRGTQVTITLPIAGERTQ